MSDSVIQNLQDILKREIACHEELAKLVERQLQAARDADAKGLRGLCLEERALVKSISELSGKRMQLVEQAKMRYLPQTQGTLSLKSLCNALPDPLADQIRPLRQSLFERMSHLTGRVRLLRATGESLLKHMQGVVRTLAVRLSESGVYPVTPGSERKTLSVSTFNATA